MLKSIIASIAIFFASIFGGHHNDVVVAIPSQPAAAVAATAQIADAFHPEDATTTVATDTPTTATATIIKQYITQPVIERIIQFQPMSSGTVLGASTSSPTLADLQNQISDLHKQMYGTGGTGLSGGGFLNALALSQRIGHLDGVTITNSTVNGTSDFSVGVTGDFLPLTGGTVTGTTTFAGILPGTARTLTAGAVKESLSATPAYGLGLALGADGFARVAFNSGNAPYPLKYARCTDADCSSPVITTVATSTGSNGYGPGSYIMTLGSDHLPRIVYLDAGNNLEFVRCTAEDCTATTTKRITSNGATDYAGFYGTMVVMGDDDLPRIEYANTQSDYEIHFVRCNDANCSTFVDTDTGANDGDYPYQQAAIAINHTDHFARMLYFDGPAGILKLMSCTNANCTATTTAQISSVNRPGNYGSVIRIGSDGNPRLAYVDDLDSSYTLHYAVCSDANCSTSPTIVDLPHADGSFYNGDLRTGNLASITYEAANHSLHIVNCSNASCSSYDDATVDTLSDAMTGGGSLVIGSDNLPRVAYSDDATGIFYARLITLDGEGVASGSTIGTSGSPFGNVFATKYYLDGSPLAAWSTNGSNIFYTGGVSIGTSSPNGSLHVGGTTRFNGDITVGNDGAVSGGSNSLTFTGFGDSGNLQTAYFNLDSFGSDGGQRLDLHIADKTVRFGPGQVQAENIYFANAAAPLINWNNPTTGLTIQNGYDQTSGHLLDVLNMYSNKFMINWDGTVGIGTTSPQSALAVQTGGSSVVTVAGAGRVGIQYNNQGAVWDEGMLGDATNDFKLKSYFTNSIPFVVENGAPTGAFTIKYNSGNIGIATTSPWRTLSVTGTVGLDGLTGATGAGSLCLSTNKEVVFNSGSDNCLSSLRATKHDIEA